MSRGSPPLCTALSSEDLWGQLGWTAPGFGQSIQRSTPRQPYPPPSVLWTLHFSGGRNNWGVLCTSLNMSTFGEVTMIIYIFKMVEWLADCNSQSVRCLRNELEKELEGGLTTSGQSMIYPKPSVLAKAATCDYFGKHLHKDRLRKDSWMYFHVLSEPLVQLSSWYMKTIDN